MQRLLAAAGTLPNQLETKPKAKLLESRCIPSLKVIRSLFLKKKINSTIIINETKQNKTYLEREGGREEGAERERQELGERCSRERKRGRLGGR